MRPRRKLQILAAELCLLGHDLQRGEQAALEETPASDMSRKKKQLISHGGLHRDGGRGDGRSRHVVNFSRRCRQLDLLSRMCMHRPRIGIQTPAPAEPTRQEEHGRIDKRGLRVSVKHEARNEAEPAGQLSRRVKPR